MKHHPIRAYEEVEREIDLFLSPFSQGEREKVKSQVVHILSQHSESDSFVKAVQSLKKPVFQMSELSIFAKLLEEDPNFLRTHASVFFFVLGEVLKNYASLPAAIEMQQDLFEALKGLTHENFLARMEEVFYQYGAIGEQIFFREAITRKLCLEEVNRFATQSMEKTQKENFEYWEYRNIQTLAVLQKRLLEGKTSPEGISLTLSGGNMNGISQIGVIEALLEQGKTIECISGSSIGGLIGTFAAFLLDPKNTPEENLEIWKIFRTEVSQGIGSLLLEGSMFKAQDRKNFQVFFETLGRNYSISERTVFSESKIPLVINGNRKYGTSLMQGQQIYMSGTERVLESIFASINVAGKYFGETNIEGIPIEDYAAAIQLNPVEALKILGKFGKDTVLVDTGSGSSDITRTGTVERIIRYLYVDTTRRDVMERIILEKSSGGIIAPDLREIYDWKNFMNIGFSLDAAKIEALIQAGKRITHSQALTQ